MRRMRQTHALHNARPTLQCGSLARRPPSLKKAKLPNEDSENARKIGTWPEIRRMRSSLESRTFSGVQLKKRYDMRSLGYSRDYDETTDSIAGLFELTG